MNLDHIRDVVNRDTMEIGKYQTKFILSPELMRGDHYGVDALNWSCVPYGTDGVEHVPCDRRGIYAFVVCNEGRVLPPHHYVMYVGITGLSPTRSLRDRYKEYLRESYVLKRWNITKIIGTWSSVLCFYFAAVDDDMTNDQLKSIEEALNSALMPPYSLGDMKADLKRGRKAF